AVLYPMLEQARAAVDVLAGPDRSAEVAALRRQAAPLEAVEAQLRAASSWLAGVEAELATGRRPRRRAQPSGPCWARGPVVAPITPCNQSGAQARRSARYPPLEARH
ncbi:MAG: hypothetical protein ACREN5_01110, partial [Gemmatimonadales bacterium]